VPKILIFEILSFIDNHQRNRDVIGTCTWSIWTIGACVFLVVSTPERPWTCLHYTEASVVPERVYNTGTWAVPGLVWTTEACAAPDVSTQQGPQLHPDMSGKLKPLLLLDVSILQSLAVSTPQWPELHLDLSGQQKLCCSWTCLHYITGTWAAPISMSGQQ
jgi:hypothetical protein